MEHADDGFVYRFKLDSKGGPGRLAGFMSMMRSQPADRTAVPATDVAMVEAARAGDRRAFELLHERYSRMVHGILLARLQPADAEDLLQDVFLTAMQKLETLTDPRTFGGWVAQIARNRTVDFLRRKRPTSEIPDQLESKAAPPTLEASEVLATIRSLPEAYGETLTLRLVEGLTGPEIAAQTGLTAGSVRVNLHRGMRLLREKLGMEARDD